MKGKTDPLEIVFYGASGWFETESGCTSCVGLFPNGRDIVLFDLGTGIRRLERDRVQGKNLTVVLSHLHLDHCYGLHILPMFRPARLTIIIHRSLQPHLAALFSYPFVKPAHELVFPVEIRPADDGLIEFGQWILETRVLQHNTPVIGARLRMEGGQSVAYCVDTSLCDGLLDLAGDCGTLIIEASPPGFEKTNGFHLDLDGLRTVLMATSAEQVILTHFGALKYPDIASRERLRAHIGDCHNDIVMAHDGLIIRR